MRFRLRRLRKGVTLLLLLGSRLDELELDEFELAIGLLGGFQRSNMAPGQACWTVTAPTLHLYTETECDMQVLTSWSPLAVQRPPAIPRANPLAHFVRGSVRGSVALCRSVALCLRRGSVPLRAWTPVRLSAAARMHSDWATARVDKCPRNRNGI